MKSFQLILIFFLIHPIFAKSIPSYNCPIVTSPSQSFCINSNPTVANLLPSDALWYGSADTEATALSPTTPLAHGTIYYAGDQAQTCTSRPQVNVSLTSQVSAGNDAFAEDCDADVPAKYHSYDAMENVWKSMLDPGVPWNGTFNPSARQVSAQYQATDIDGYKDFTTTYTVGDAGCQDSVDLTIRMYEVADAGTDATVTLLNNAAPVNLKDYLGGNPSNGGSWSVLVDGIFDPTTDAEGDFIYTVDGCTGMDSSTVSVNVIPPGCPTVLEPIQSFCRSSFPGNKIRDLVATDNGGGVAWYIDNSSTTALSAEMDIEDGDVYYAGALDSSNCLGERTAVTVNFLETPNAGKTTFLTFSSTDPTVDLRDLIIQSQPDWAVDSSGYMIPNTKAGGTIFTPSLDGNWTGEKQLTHIVTSISECPDDQAIVYITITPQINTGHRLVFLGRNEIEAQAYLDNNQIKNEEGLLVNIWKTNQLEVNSVYRINVNGEDRFYYVNNIYSAPQSGPDLTLTSDTEIEQNFSIEVFSSTLQEVTEVGGVTSNRLDFQGGLTINNDQLFLDGSTMNISFPLEVNGAADSSAVKLLDGGIRQKNNLNSFQGVYKYQGDGILGLLNNTTTSNLFLYSSDTSKTSLLSLQLDEVALSIGYRAAPEKYYSLRKKIDSLTGNIEVRFDDNGLKPVSFQPDTSAIFTGQLQIGDSIVTGYDLVVKGAMISESMVMDLQSNWPDYVFFRNYELPSLASIKAYIGEYKHLPGMPTATKVAREGLDVAENSRKLLEKIEELTLHLLDLQKGIKEIELQNKKIGQQIKKLDRD